VERPIDIILGGGYGVVVEADTEVRG